MGSNSKLGLIEATSMAVGGMVGGGIFAAMGGVATEAGTLGWLSFLFAATVAMAAAYSCLTLNKARKGEGGPITYIQQFNGNTDIAGMAGWTFIAGYIGTNAMYATAFGTYLVGWAGWQDAFGGLARPVISFAVIAGFVGINLAGAHSSGKTEEIIVVIKVAILLGFGIAGLWMAMKRPQGVVSGFDNLGLGAITAAGIAFVAFEGWELLLYDQHKMEGGQSTLSKSIYYGIIISVIIYLIIVIVTTNLVPTLVKQNPNTALNQLAHKVLPGLGVALMSIAALLSTGSAINATIFSAGQFMERMVEKNQLPDQFGSGNIDNPNRSILTIGLAAAAFSMAGSLGSVTQFSSVTFVILCGGLSLLAFRNHSKINANRIITGGGFVGAVVVAVSLFYHLFQTKIHTFWLLICLLVAVFILEVLYFEHDWMIEEVEDAEKDV
ncbi:MAG: APC family permease [Halobacteria archaeon]